MKKTEKIVAAVCVMVFGVLFMLLKNYFIGVSTTILGVTLLVFGVLDIFQQKIVWAVVKIVFAALVIIGGWALLEAVLYLLSTVLFAVGILLLYDFIRYKACGFCVRDVHFWVKVLQAAFCFIIGVLFLFEPSDWVFITSGIFILLEGGVLLFEFIKYE